MQAESKSNHCVFRIDPGSDRPVPCLAVLLTYLLDQTRDAVSGKNIHAATHATSCLGLCGVLRRLGWPLGRDGRRCFWCGWWIDARDDYRNWSGTCDVGRMVCRPLACSRERSAQRACQCASQDTQAMKEVRLRRRLKLLGWHSDILSAQDGNEVPRLAFDKWKAEQG